MSGILAGIGLWALFMAALLARMYLVKLASDWAYGLSIDLQDAAHEAGNSWWPAYWAFENGAEAAWRWRSILNLRGEMRYADFYPELERLRRATA